MIEWSCTWHPLKPGALLEMHPLCLLTLVMTEPGRAGTHPYYMIDKETKAQKGSVICQSSPVLRNRVWAPREGLSQGPPPQGEWTTGTQHGQGSDYGPACGFRSEQGYLADFRCIHSSLQIGCCQSPTGLSLPERPLEAWPSYCRG